MFSLQNGWAWQLVSLQNEVNTENSTKWPGIYQNRWFLMNREIRGYIDHVRAGGHMSMYKNKDSFCRHVPGHADPLRFLQMSQDTPTSSNKNLYKITSTFFTCPRIPPQVRTRISTKWVYGKMSLQSDPTLYKNSLYKMTEPKPIFWAKPCMPSHFVPEISRGIQGPCSSQLC